MAGEMATYGKQMHKSAVGCVFQMENIMESHKLEVSSKETTTWPFVTGRLAR
jgi:hypothetical protein